MAAGMSTRFVPLSIETPKALLKVKGEVLIERQINQLREANIQEIVVVVGYLKEKFEYLQEKYGVILIENPDYKTKNNHSTLYAARRYLKNTFICSGDNYFAEIPELISQLPESGLRWENSQVRLRAGEASLVEGGDQLVLRADGPRAHDRANRLLPAVAALHARLLLLRVFPWAVSLHYTPGPAFARPSPVGGGSRHAGDGRRSRSSARHEARAGRARAGGICKKSLRAHKCSCDLQNAASCACFFGPNPGLSGMTSDGFGVSPVAGQMLLGPLGKTMHTKRTFYRAGGLCAHEGRNCASSAAAKSSRPRRTPLRALARKRRPLRRLPPADARRPPLR